MVVGGIGAVDVRDFVTSWPVVSLWWGGGLVGFVTDRQSDKFFDTIYVGMGTFFQSKLSTSLLASLAGG